ncbi:asparagine synthase [Nostoc commune NIES-4072]|uniref:asparagine synthase (glutamine-hydrolyzing) n=1 Tax=Nostoc commune NIES-4072 TaxID=2005467 RepID=A0A2R5FVQ2_NOSCO|nr:asparagine synthase-related protein [Nostoc commune]BBD70182.1 asparagine synthase [Nostoc commune HK-02]GBG22836.1 asparagine synthase [Nostoc commune NIES-4072]
MLFDAFKSRKSSQNLLINPNPTWRVAWGEVNASYEDIAWRDEKFLVILPRTVSGFLAEKLAISSEKQFVVVGDIWLTNQVQLLEQLGIEPDSFGGNYLQLVANLWEQWGNESLKQLVGMFALVVWDREKQVLQLIRDRIGSRTLYYTNTGAVRWIAPQLRTLSPYRSSDLDLVALRDYLCCAFVPGERTLWEQVRELRPGSVLQFPDEKVQTYWQLQEQITAIDQPLVWHGDRLRELLNQVIQEYLPPQNEPVGVFLSGGLDSSSITALAAKFHSSPVHTFSIHFGAECPNELEFSSLVATHCQTQHHILEITFADMWERLPQTMAYLDDPIGDPLTIPNLLLGQLARESVQVVLNGEGGDPCFGGPKNQPMLINSLYGSVTNQDSLQAYLISFQKCAADLPQLLKPEVLTAIQTAPWIFEEDLYSQASYLNRLMAMNIKFKGADQILTKVSNLTQAADLQGRSPLFDQRVVHLSMTIPPEYKLSGVSEKAVLKQAIADILPESIIHRPKSGMMVPVQLGFRKYWQKEARDLLLNRNAAIAPYFNQLPIRNWLNYQGDTWSRYGVKLWLLVSLEIWLQVNRK